MYLRPPDLMYLLPLPPAALTLVGLDVPVRWWWLLALPYLMAGLLGAIGAVVDVALARMVEQAGPHSDP